MRATFSENSKEKSQKRLAAYAKAFKGKMDNRGKEEKPSEEIKD